jgi:hypothetical protein
MVTGLRQRSGGGQRKVPGHLQRSVGGLRKVQVLSHSGLGQ